MELVMKKYYVLMVSILMFAAIKQGVSQTPHCDGDPCVNASNCGTWVQATPLIISLDPACPACDMEIHYKYRDNSACSNACPTAPPFEFQIDFVITDGACFYPCNGNPAKFNFGDLDKFYMQAVFELIKLYSSPFIAPSGGCGPVIPNFKGTSCKKEYLAPDGNVYILTCVETECCVQNLQYCIDSLGNENMIKTNIYSPSDNCGLDPDGLSCSYSCDWEWEESLVPKKVKVSENNSYNNFELDYSINPSTLNLKLNGVLNGILSLNIFSADGVSHVYDTFNVNGSNFEINLDNNFTNGAYYIAFNLNGKLIKIENIIMVK